MELAPTLLEPGRAFVSRLALFLPNLLAALAILLAGWALARFVRLVFFRFLLAVRLDVAAERAGIDDILARAEIRQSPAELVVLLGYWVVLLLALLTAVNTLGLAAVADLLNQVLLYVPKVIAAVVVLILGLFFANFLAGLIRAAATSAGLPEAAVLASLSRWALVVFTAAVTLSELGVGAELVHSAFNIVFGAVALALALAVGLGCKDLARDWVARYLEAARRKGRPH
jgi:flagellar biosynthesis protein FliQ